MNHGNAVRGSLGLRVVLDLEQGLEGKTSVSASEDMQSQRDTTAAWSC